MPVLHLIAGPNGAGKTTLHRVLVAPRLVATLAAGQMQLHTVLRPRWVEKVLGFAER